MILEAATGRVGLALYHTHPLDCVELEIELPDMSGFEALLKLVTIAERPEIPVVVLTKLDHTAFLALALKNGACKALRKSGTSGDVLDQTNCQGHRHRSARKVSKPNEPRATA